MRFLALPRASSQIIQRAGHALAALAEHMAAAGRCLQIRALWAAATAHFCRWAATASSNRSDMFIVHESKQNRLKPHRGGMVASGAVHAAPMELERILGCAATINMALRSSPRRVRRSWVRVPPVELGGSRRNGQVPVQPQGWRGLSSPGKEPTGRNEDEPHRMSPVMLNERRRRASGALCEGRCSQESQSPCPANSVGVSVVSTSGRHASDKRGGPGR